jgi:tetratricopeptide (TPR) repeat protein
MVDACEQARALANELGESTVKVSSMIAIAQGRSIREGATPEILKQAEEAAELAQTVNEPRLLGQTRAMLGLMLQWHGKYERSASHLQKGLELAREAHAGFIFGMTFFALGHVALSCGEYEQAYSWYRQSGDYAEAAGDAFWLARCAELCGRRSARTV